MLEHTLSDEEHNQIVQTIEMFEAITQTQPDDYQSLEILKEAYQKVGKHDDCLRVSRRLGRSHARHVTRRYANGRGSWSPLVSRRFLGDFLGTRPPSVFLCERSAALFMRRFSASRVDEERMV